MQALNLNNETLAAIRRELYWRDFYEFRIKLWKMKGNKKPFKHGWWQREVAKELMQFYDDYLQGKRPKLIIKTPPQHGKSDQLTDFVIWICGKHPSLKSIFASFSESLGVRTNTAIQRAMLHPDWVKIFPNTRMGAEGSESKAKTKVIRAKRNNELIEFEHYGGSFRNTTTSGKITGESLDLGFIDDPIKGREEANSETVRNKKWEWFVDDFFTRFAEDSGFICIGTNWHVDDPIQRMIERFGDSIRVVSYPAIAIDNEKYRKKGEPLFPEHKSLEFLLERKKLMEPANWEALYQQSPIIAGGNKFKTRMFDFIEMPTEFDYTFTVMDSAYKDKKTADFSVVSHFGVLDGELYLNDMWRDQIDAADIEVPVTSFIKKHESYSYRKTLIEPKGHGIYLNQKLGKLGLGIPFEEDVKEFFKDRKLSKTERANNAIPHLSDKVLHININLAQDLKDDIRSELLQFPHGKHDDIVDTIIDAIKEAFSSETTIWDILQREKNG